MTELVKKDTFGVGISEAKETRLYATFTLGDEIFGVEAVQVQEIVPFQKMTPVPHCPEFILGLINLRGQIFTALDLRYRLTGEHVELDEESSLNFILKTPSGVCSLIVDDVGDVLDIESDRMEPPPETMNPQMREYILQICKMDDRLLCVLDIEKIVSTEK
jgi:purine-binding chemotaxis protein CheW